MHWALQSIKRNNRSGLIAGLTLTFLLGLTFLLIQAREYTRLGFGPSDLAFASTFFGLTGLHGVHVFIGLNLLLYALIRSLRGHYGPEGAGPPRRRAAGDLLALRGRNVDRGVHDGVRDLSTSPGGAMRNPFRTEAEAFGFVLVCVALFASWRWPGSSPAAGWPSPCSSSSAPAVAFYVKGEPKPPAESVLSREARRSPPHPRRRERDGRRPRAPRRGRSPCGRGRRRPRRLPGSQLSAPPLGLRRGRSPGRSRAAARGVARQRSASEGVEARGEVGDADPIQAMDDALRTFGADEIVISTHPPGRSNWLEKEVIERARERYPVADHARGRRPRA